MKRYGNEGEKGFRRGRNVILKITDVNVIKLKLMKILEIFLLK